MTAAGRMEAPDQSTPPGTGLDGLGATWLHFWFNPADVRPLAAVRILAAALGLLLLWSYAGDLEAWFGPGGMVPHDVAEAWRPTWGVSLFDLATTAESLWLFFGATAAAFAAMLLGVATPVSTLAAAVLWTSLLHRGSMLAGPADDCLAVLLWCLVVGPSGRAWSVDRMLADRLGRPTAMTSVAARVSLGLVQVHAAALTVAALLAQLKGDVWWDGTAAWWLASRAGAVDLRAAYTRSEYVMNLVTHAIVAFEIAFAIGIWFTPTRRAVGRIAIVAWPVIGLLAGEPLWGLAMAIFAVPSASRRG